MTRQESIASYLEYVNNIIQEFAKTQDIIDDGEVTPERVHTAMANHFVVSSALNAEYQRIKWEHRTLELDYQAWHDKKLDEARTTLIAVYQEELKSAAATKSKGSLVKPSVSEYGVQLRLDNADEFRTRTLELDQSEAKMRFMLRMVEMLDRQYSILQSISSNMRAEMRTLGMDADMSTISEEVLRRRATRTR
jgi:hypothetical protein